MRRAIIVMAMSFLAGCGGEASVAGRDRAATKAKPAPVELGPAAARARADEVLARSPARPPLSPESVDVVDALPGDWGRATAAEHVFATAGGDARLPPSIVLVAIEDDGEVTLDGLGRRYRGHTDELGVTYGRQERIEALGHDDVLLVHGVGTAAGITYVLDRGFLIVDDELHGFLVTMVDADVARHMPEALELLRHDIRLD